ncbi:MAG TPA: hypothetical protein VG755_00495 [Nannocystaceae bacterium]|nr:hypothetical protein [Nannocystaceae bacterium]
MRASSLVVGAALSCALARPVAAADPPRTSQVVDAQGQPVAEIVERKGERTTLTVPPGRYRVVASDGSARDVTVGDDGVLAVGTAAEPTRAAAPSDDAGGVPAPRDTTRAGSAPPDEPAKKPRKDRSKHRRWGAPLAATFLPGSGHAIAGRPGAGFGIFAGAAALTFAAIATGIGGDPREGTTLGDPKRSASREVLRTGGFVLATDALALLWLGQIADAWVQATGKRVRGRTQHAVAVSLQRASAVGMRPGEPAIARYDDFSLAVLGQVIPRLWLGLADLTVHTGGSGRPVTLQVGARVAGRVLERDRVWLVLAGGAILQGTRARSTLPPIGDAPAERERGRFGATVYGQIEARIFVLDRLSLDIAPRLSVPLATRYYGHDRAIPRWAPTLELVAGPEVYF